MYGRSHVHRTYVNDFPAPGGGTAEPARGARRSPRGGTAEPARGARRSPRGGHGEAGRQSRGRAVTALISSSRPNSKSASGSGSISVPARAAVLGNSAGSTAAYPAGSTAAGPPAAPARL